jgi:glycosyltransferase involved in cell wall biosynthesis
VKPQVPTLARLPAAPTGRAGWPWDAAPPPLPPCRADGSPWPRISIVTGSHNQGEFLEETLRSVLLQGYPNLEYIVIDGGSTDGSWAVIERYAPWLAHHEAQPDRGQAAALNSGFARASGEILAFLNSDDTYLPGALARAAEEIDARRRRHLVIGRCIFVDAAGRALGNEHPSRAVSHHRLLAVWKGHTIPQPAAFWSRAAWSAGGPLAADAGVPWIDYGLFCRMTRRHRLHAIDQILATYRLHPRSITTSGGGGAALAQVVSISRRYWGPAWTPRHLALAASLALHRLDRLGRARALLRRALARRARGRRIGALALTTLAAAVAPALVARLALERRLARGLPPWLPGGPAASGRRPGAVLPERNQPWLDRWAGPRLQLHLAATGGESRLRIEGTAAPAYLGAALGLQVRVDGRGAGTAEIGGEGPFAVDLPLPLAAAPGSCRVEIEAAPWFVPHTILGNHDRRQLCWLVESVRLQR